LPCAQIEASLCALYRSISLFVVGVATWVATQIFLETGLPWLTIFASEFGEAEALTPMIICGWESLPHLNRSITSSLFLTLRICLIIENYQLCFLALVIRGMNSVCRKRRTMKRVIILVLVCISILFAAVVSSVLTSSRVQAGSGPAIQMFSGTFTDKNLPVDGVTKITLVSIPFTVRVTSNLEVTNFMDVTPNGAYGYATCELDIDSVSFFSVTTSIPANSTNVPVGLTNVTTGITAGSHTFTVQCLGYSQYGQGSYVIHSRGTSVIVTK
jgi:hypothetical protein